MPCAARQIAITALIVAVQVAASPPANWGAHLSWIDAGWSTGLAEAQAGAIELVLEARRTDGDAMDAKTLANAATIVERRLVALGAAAVVVRVLADGDIVVRASGLVDPEAAVAALLRPGLLEIIDPRGQFLRPGTVVRTTLDGLGPTDEGGAATPRAVPVATPASPVYETIVSGADLADSFVTEDVSGAGPVVGFRLNEAGGRKLQAFTAGHIGQPMSIVLDKVVVSTPVIQAAVRDQGIISGIPANEVDELVAVLRSDPLPVTLVVAERRVTSASAAAATATN